MRNRLATPQGRGQRIFLRCRVQCDVDQIVNGTTRLPGAFPDGDDLNVRYRVDQNNTDKWSGLVGMTFGLKRGIGVIAEAAFGEDSHRYMASAYYRF